MAFARQQPNYKKKYSIKSSFLVETDPNNGATRTLTNLSQCGEPPWEIIGQDTESSRIFLAAPYGGRFRICSMKTGQILGAYDIESTQAGGNKYHMTMYIAPCYGHIYLQKGSGDNSVGYDVASFDGKTNKLRNDHLPLLLSRNDPLQASLGTLFSEDGSRMYTRSKESSPEQNLAVVDTTNDKILRTLSRKDMGLSGESAIVQGAYDKKLLVAGRKGKEDCVYCVDPEKGAPLEPILKVPHSATSRVYLCNKGKKLVIETWEQSFTTKKGLRYMNRVFSGKLCIVDFVAGSQAHTVPVSADVDMKEWPVSPVSGDESKIEFKTKTKVYQIDLNAARIISVQDRKPK